MISITTLAVWTSQDLNLHPACSCSTSPEFRKDQGLSSQVHLICRTVTANLEFDSVPRLFRHHMNMERMSRSVERIALPVRTTTLSTNIRFSRSTHLDRYPALTPCLGVNAGCTPRHHLHDSPVNLRLQQRVPPPVRHGRPDTRVALLNGRVKARLNYVAGFPAQHVAAAPSCQQSLWVLDETVAEAGAMIVFAVFERPEGGMSQSSLLPRRSVRMQPSQLGHAHRSPVALAELDVAIAERLFPA